ncbi:uncharacterized protein LOC112574769 [Pomacea canaliculata]|uniref:uncharacterized protein LOC112574769 n=1 Tax=Pomacea canaliculata TaxID=400727 RepID=UPI000D73EFC7|nr:uncharacterized protein LOC112574769 [Pomacea canaliculata]XP_025111810.1 uncharacterized protein LOC112574769 [Pomacea canaliculata]
MDGRIQKVCSVIVDVPGSIDIPEPTELVSLEEMLKHCMEKLINMCLVVFLHPPSTMITEKGKVASRDRDTSDVNNSKKFSTSVGLLGGSVLEGTLEITEVNMKLMFREDIAASLRDVTTNTSSFQIHGDLMTNKKSTDRRNSECEQKCCMKMYENVRVENFTRRDQKNVYKQICHAIYDVVFESPPTGWKFKGKVLSLPIVVRTGANQASEHKGAQLWYGFSAQNVYDVTSAVVSSLSLDQVVQMMDERICFIGGRSLLDYEKKFLREKLECAVKSGKTSRESGDKITLDAFIKERVQLASHYPGGPGDTVTFSLWRWFHCIVNLLREN